MSNQRSKKGRAKGAGCIFKRGAVYYLQYDVNGKRKKVSLGETELRKAQAKAKELIEPLKSAKTKEDIALHVGRARKLLKSGKAEIKDTWELYMKSPGRPDSSDGTIGNYKRHWERFVAWLGNAYPNAEKLGQISDDIAKEYFKELWETGISANTYNYHRQALRLIVRVVKDTAGIADNPFDCIVKKAENKQARKELSEKEVIKLLEFFDSEKLTIMHKEEMRVMFHLGAWTGLRLIDCALMKWECVDMAGKKVMVVPHKTMRKRQAPVVILMHPHLFTALNEALEWRKNEYVLPQIANRYQYNAHGVDQDALEVFRQVGFDTTRKVSDKGQRLRKANIYGFHSFRHSFVSFCANAGVPLPVVQSIVGHGNPAITRHYIHVGENAVQQAIAALPDPSSGSIIYSPEDKVQKAVEILQSKKRLNQTEKQLMGVMLS